MTARKISVVAAINNAISAELLRQDLAARDIPLTSVALILLRDVSEPWMEQCAVVLRYPGRPSTKLSGQWRFLSFYSSAARLLRSIEKSAKLRHIYIVNNDNLVATHLLYAAQRQTDISVTVVAEGLMNFQDIARASREGWRWRTKPGAARLLGFHYREPQDHLSGAFEPRVSRVVSFASEGLKSPPEKVVVRHFEPICPGEKSDPSIALVVLTGLNRTMGPAEGEYFARAFADWIRSSGFKKIQVKKHPRASAGLIEELLADCEEVGDGLTTETLASHLEAGTIVGTCCTALVTMKLIRPDLHCIDFGSDFYCEHAYDGDNSVKTLFTATGVSLVQIPFAEDDASRRVRSGT